MPFKFEVLDCPGLIVIQPEVFPDDRGFMLETYARVPFEAHGIPDAFVLDLHSRSPRGVLRGLHYQKDPEAQGKLVRVVRGKVFNVAADIRRGSPTYGQWRGVEVSDENHRMLWIPPGFANGYCVLSDEADYVYKTTAGYAPELYRGIVWNDSALGIQWPVADPILAPRDAEFPSLEEADNNYRY